MGLRLYQAPAAESQAKPQPPAEKSPAHARSQIRRRPLSHMPEHIRERRRRILSSSVAPVRSGGPRRSSSSYDPTIPGQAPPVIPNPYPNPPESGRIALRDMARGLLDDRGVAQTGERWANLHAFNASPSGGLELDPPPYLPSDMQPTADSQSLRRRRTGVPTQPIPTSDLRMTLGPNFTGVARFTAEPAPISRANANNAPRHDPRRELEELIHHYQPSMLWRRPVLNPRLTEDDQANQIDGLGDRNRSLSPEGDHVWDTLLSTVTPDPQPPSVGSSFASASASASAATSQSTAAGSAGTSLTSPDVVDGPVLEQPCESDCDNSDSEADDDVHDEDEDEDDEDIEMDENTWIRFSNAMARVGRSYADAARSNGNEESLELLGGIGGMQHIVRSLARREDIPDEWWAEAGLSRTLPREDSAN